MNRWNRNLLAVVIAGGVCGGAGLVRADVDGVAPSAQRLDEPHWKHVHMHRALGALGEARHDLETAEEVFRGHRDEAIGHVDKAIEAIQAGLRQVNDEAANPVDLPSARQLDGRFPHMHHALAKLQEAHDELEAADKTAFGEHRDRAIEATEKAMSQLQDGIHDAER